MANHIKDAWELKIVKVIDTPVVELHAIFDEFPHIGDLDALFQAPTQLQIDLLEIGQAVYRGRMYTLTELRKRYGN
tara:strand:+ start:18 stop:245 length:228 start_codon:yes stop_codon:yes gene_type:complete